VLEHVEVDGSCRSVIQAFANDTLVASCMLGVSGGGSIGYLTMEDNGFGVEVGPAAHGVVVTKSTVAFTTASFKIWSAVESKLLARVNDPTDFVKMNMDVFKHRL
jgi:hypothetical protein